MLASRSTRPAWTIPALALLAVAALIGGLALSRREAPKPDNPSLPVAFRGSSTSSRDALIAALQERLKANPRDYSASIDLANTYMQKVRETADPSLYTKAGDLLRQAEEIDPSHPALYASRGALALARHDFAAALREGQKAVVADPSNAMYYGVVGDALVELGRYEQAVATYQAMVDRKPGFQSYARVAHARELYGDPEGAAQAMRTALDSGAGVAENLAWAHVQLGNLYFGVGKRAEADREYTMAVKTLPGYALALAGQAQVAAAAGDLRRAATLYESAFNTMPSPEYAILLGDVYAKLGEDQKAAEQYALVEAIHRLQQANGVNTDLETALFFADHEKDLEGSLAKARAAYAARPSIHAADALAWTLYKTRSYDEARKYAEKALELNTRDSMKLYHAGMIAKALGKTTEARRRLGQALALNPRFAVLHSDRAAAALEELGGPLSAPEAEDR